MLIANDQESPPNVHQWILHWSSIRNMTNSRPFISSDRQSPMITNVAARWNANHD
jgi:hypothetical protein